MLLGAVNTIGATVVVGVVVVVVVVSAELTVVTRATGSTATKSTRARTERMPRLVRINFMAFLSHCYAPGRSGLRSRSFGLLCVVMRASPSDGSCDTRPGLRTSCCLLRYFVLRTAVLRVRCNSDYAAELRSAWAGQWVEVRAERSNATGDCGSDNNRLLVVHAVHDDLVVDNHVLALTKQRTNLVAVTFLVTAGTAIVLNVTL